MYSRLASGMKQGVGDIDVTLANGGEALGDVGRLLLRGADQAEQRIGDAAARRQHDRQPAAGIRFENRRDALHARRVRDARAAELVYTPTLHQYSVCRHANRIRAT